eukprot:763100-Hanusia_phi.AAC.6
MSSAGGSGCYQYYNDQYWDVPCKDYYGGYSNGSVVFFNMMVVIIMMFACINWIPAVSCLLHHNAADFCARMYWLQRSEEMRIIRVREYPTERRRGVTAGAKRGEVAEEGS